MSTKVFFCDQCGSPVDFGGESNVVCQTCGVNNVNIEAEKAILEARTFAESYLGDLENLEVRLKASGDATARDYIFTKDFKPRLDVVFEDLIEKFDEYFRRPLFQLNILRKYNQLFDINKIFETEQKKGYSKHFTRELNQFAMGQLSLYVMKLLAASEISQNHIDTLKHHSMFLSRLYNMRGIALTINENSITTAEKLMKMAIEDSKTLQNNYSKIKDEITNSIKFQIWEQRLNLNLKIAEILRACLNKQYEQIKVKCEELIKNVDITIRDLREKNTKDEKIYPLFLIMVSIEGFNIDKKIIQFLSKIVEVIIKGEFKSDFLSILTHLDSIIDIADTPFNNAKLPSPEWDPDWISTLEEPFDRLFQLLDNLVINRKIIKKEFPVYLIKADENIFRDWKSNQIIEGKQLNKSYFAIKDDFSVKSTIPLYIPIATMSTYAILKTGFIRKGGDEVESFLLINPFFRFDPTINNYGYAMAFGYIDIEESLKEKDPLKQQLESIENIIESGSKAMLDGRIILPILVTKKEIEEFVQKTYDLFEIVQEGRDPIPKFNQMYKDVGIAKKVEKLSAELLDYIYIPALLLELASGTVRKGEFQAKSQYEWKLLLPYNNIPKDPWNYFIQMNITPASILNLATEIQKLN